MYGVEGCQAILFHETRVEPAEYCGEDVEEDTEFCEDHRGCDQ